MMTRRFVAPTLVSAILTSLLTFAGLSILGSSPRAQLPSSLNCQSICSSVPKEEQTICIDACKSALEGSTGNGTTGGTTGSTTGGGAFGGDLGGVFLPPLPEQPTTPGPLEPDPLRPAAPPADHVITTPPPPDACIPVAFRKDATGFCIRADRCFQDRLIERGFRPDPSCQQSVSFLTVYRTAGLHGAASAPPSQALSAPLDLTGIITRTIAAVEEILPRIPADSSAAPSAQDLRSYLTTLRESAAARDLTALETDATAQYIRLRVLDTIAALEGAAVPLSPHAPAGAETRAQAQEDLSTILYTLLPRLFEQLTPGAVAGLNVAMARSLHGEAADTFEAAKQSCARDRLSGDCLTALQTVIRTLKGLEQILRPPLEQAGILAQIERELSVSAAATHAAPSEQGFPRPRLEP